MLLFDVMVNTAQKALLDALKDVQFGEILDVELSSDDGKLPTKVSRQTKDLIELVKDGNSFFRKIKIHQGEPTLAEVPYAVGGFKCIKQYRFN
jgi:hypothetical protein